MAKIHDRILQITLTTDDSDNTLVVASGGVKYFRDRGMLDAGTGRTIPHTPTTAQTSPAEIVMGDLVPPPTIIRFVFTAQA